MTSNEMERCGWAQAAGSAEIGYHDSEWGVPVHDDATLFEFLVLEGAQAGLSWRTILEKRAGYRRAFASFDAATVAQFSDAHIEELLQDTAIVRNRLKVRSAVSNAQKFLEIQASHGSFDDYLWAYVDGIPIQGNRRYRDEVPVNTELSDRLSKDLKRRGFKFVGSTIMYSYLQAVGLINDHVHTCFRHAALK